jgi:hypothetical protein
VSAGGVHYFVVKFLEEGLLVIQEVVGVKVLKELQLVVIESSLLMNRLLINLVEKLQWITFLNGVVLFVLIVLEIEPLNEEGVK